MKLTKTILYKLIKEEMERIYQVSNSLIKRLMSDPNVPDDHREKLLTMLQSGDEDAIESAALTMDTLGYGEGYETMDIPISDEPKDEKQFYYGDSRRMHKQRKSDVQVGQFLGTKPFRFIVSDVFDQIYSMGRRFTDRVAVIYPNMENNNFAGIQNMRDALEEKMKQHYTQVYEQSKGSSQ